MQLWSVQSLYTTQIIKREREKKNKSASWVLRDIFSLASLIHKYIYKIYYNAEI